MEINKYQFVKKSYKKEKELLSNNISSLALSSKNKLIKYLNYEIIDDLYFVSNDETVLLTDAVFFYVDVNNVGTFHFVFKDDVNIQEIKEKVLTLKSKTGKDKKEEIKKINSLIEIVSSYHPLFAFVAFPYKNISHLGLDNLDYPFIYVDKREYKEEKDRGPVLRFITNPLVYINLMASFIMASSTGFAIYYLYQWNALAALFFIILAGCIALFIIVEYNRCRDNEKVKLFKLEDISYYLVSLASIALGEVIFYFVAKDILKPKELPPYNTIILISASASAVLVVVNKLIGYFIAKKKERSDKEYEEL